MKICLISHSNAAPRQQAFGKALSQYADVLMLCPTTWGKHHNESKKENNFEIFCEEVQNAGDMSRYCFSDLAFQKIKEFAPDVIYQQNDIQCNQPKVSLQWANQLGCRYVQFCWENIKRPTDKEKEFLKLCDLVIAGNDEAAEFHGTGYIIPQVGIEIERFAPQEKKEIDVLFLGRMVPEKGIQYIKEAYPDTVFLSDVPYEEVPTVMAKAKIFVSAPYDTPGWKEQFAAYSSIEAMACGVPVITTNTASVKYWLHSSPALLVPMKDSESLRECILHLLEYESERQALSKDSRHFAEQFDNDRVARLIIHTFQEVFNLA